jgi:hypothetical protein
MATIHKQFETAIRQLTQPFKGQFPRPWMTDLTDPLTASLFIVGMNQATSYPTDKLTHERHMNALFNRAGESCRGLYDEMRGSAASPTRVNVDRLRRALNQEGVERILETNVVCYSTRMSSDLRFSEHAGGGEHGTEIFRVLMQSIKPKVLIAHGVRTAQTLGEYLGKPLPPPPSEPSEPLSTNIDGRTVFVIPSLAPPGWNKWCRWADSYLAAVAKAAAEALEVVT